MTMLKEYALGSVARLDVPVLLRVSQSSQRNYSRTHLRIEGRTPASWNVRSTACSVNDRLVLECRHLLVHFQQSAISSTKVHLARPCVLAVSPPRHRFLALFRLNELPLLVSWRRRMLLPHRRCHPLGSMTIAESPFLSGDGRCVEGHVRDLFELQRVVLVVDAMSAVLFRILDKCLFSTLAKTPRLVCPSRWHRLSNSAAISGECVRFVVSARDTSAGNRVGDRHITASSVGKVAALLSQGIFVFDTRRSKYLLASHANV